MFEVAYSRRLPDGRVERGTIDCLVVTDESATVLEFKTGAPSDEHRFSWRAYLEAVARALVEPACRRAASFTWVRGRRAEFRPDYRNSFARTHLSRKSLSVLKESLPSGVDVS